MIKATFDEVQAVLLSSEQAPHDEVISALAAVAHFADTDFDCEYEQFLALCQLAWEQRTVRV